MSEADWLCASHTLILYRRDPRPWKTSRSGSEKDSETIQSYPATYLIISVHGLASGQLIHPPGLMVMWMMVMMVMMVVGVVAGRGQHLGAHAVLG